MVKRKIKSIIDNEKGSGLVLALMVLLVLSVLGASLGVVTIGSLQLSTVNRDINSAYYIAEAGANMAYEEFKKDVEESYDESTVTSDTSFFSNINSKVQNLEKPYRTYGIDNMNDFETQFGDTPTSIINIEPPSSTDTRTEREYTIHSVGEVNGKERVVAKPVTVIWKDKPTAGGGTFPTIPAEAAVIVKGEIELASGKITGDIYIDSDEEKTFVLDNSGSNIFKGVYSNYLGEKNNIYDEIPSWYSSARKKEIYDSTTNPMTVKIDWGSIKKYKENLQNKKQKAVEVRKKPKEEQYKNINLNRKENIDLSSHSYYQRENLKINGHYEITVGNKDVVILTDEMTTGGDTDITVVGTGTLTFVISDSAKINGKFKLDGRNIRIVSLAGAEINISGDSILTAEVYAPESDVVITASGKVVGNITADEVQITGGGELTGNILTDEIKITTSSPVVGNIFAEEVNMTGGGTVTGNIVAKEVEIYGGRYFLGSVISEVVKVYGGGSIAYHQFAFEDSGTGTGSEQPNNKDGLIEPGPTIESDE